jgi:hypothetical protein
MKCTAENVVIRIKSPVVDLHFVAALNRWLRSSAQRRGSKEYPGIIFRKRDPPLNRKDKVFEGFVRIPEKAWPAITLDDAIRELAKSAGPGHTPTIKIG